MCNDKLSKYQTIQDGYSNNVKNFIQLNLTLTILKSQLLKCFFSVICCLSKSPGKIISHFQFRGKSRKFAISDIESFMIKVNAQKLLTSFKESSIFNVAMLLDSTLLSRISIDDRFSLSNASCQKRIEIKCRRVPKLETVIFNFQRLPNWQLFVQS